MRIGSIILTVALGLPAGLAGQTRAYELDGSTNWREVTAATTTRPAGDATLDQLEKLLVERRYKAAHTLVVQWLKATPGAPLRDRGLYLLAEANFHRNRRFMAFFNLDELMDNYPASPYFALALQRQYDIAEAYLAGYKNRCMGIPMFSATEEAIEMLYRIQQRAPGSPLAEKSLLRTADYYYAEEAYDLAGDAYAAYALAYPKSAELPRVRFRQALASLFQFRGPRFDATPAIDARQQLVDVMAIYPEMSQRQGVPQILDRIDSAMARKFVQTADFYRRTSQPSASAYYLRYVIRTYPKLPEAAEAAEALAKLPADLREQRPLNPATRPQTP